MKTNRTAMIEWATYCNLFSAGAIRSELLKAAKAMKHKANRKAALMNLGIMTACEQKQIEARWNSINAVREKECRLHCQLDGMPAV